MATLTQQSFANPTTSYFLTKGDIPSIASQWSSYPATQDVNIASNSIENVSSINFTGTQPSSLYADGTHLFYNNQIIVNASDLQEIGDWALYPAIADIDANNNDITSVNSIELNTETITATPNAVLVNGNDQTANWALFPATQSVDFNGGNISNVFQTETATFILSNQIIQATPSAIIVNGIDQTSNWAYFTANNPINAGNNPISNITDLTAQTISASNIIATNTISASNIIASNLSTTTFITTNVSTSTINGQTQFGADQWSSFRATQNVNISAHNLDNVFTINMQGPPGFQGGTICNVAGIRPQTAGMSIGSSPVSYVNDSLITRQIFCGDPVASTGALVLNGPLTALNSLTGHTIGNLPVAGIYTNRIDLLPLGGIDMFSPLFITLNAAAAFNITGGGAVAIAGNVITCDHDPTTQGLRVKGTGGAGGKITFPNGGDIVGANNIDSFSATLQLLTNRPSSSSIGIQTNTLNINGTPILVPPSFSNTQLNLQGSLTATQLITASSCIVSNEITASNIPIASTISTRTTNVFYVAKNGNDANPGSILLPKLTIQNAITSAEALNPGATSQIVIEVAPGQYTENLTFSRGYTTVKSYSTFSDMNEVVELTGNITVNITTGAPDLFNRQVILQGFSITGSITDTSTIQHSLAITSCRFFGDNRLVYQNSTTDNRTYLDDLTIAQNNTTANTDPLIQINTGTIYVERMNATAKNNCSVIAINGTAIIGRMFNTTLESTTSSATAAPILSITSTSLSPHNIGTTSFVYTSPTNKTGSATSCGILFNTTANAQMTLQFCSFLLLGTSDPVNHAVGDAGAGNPGLGFFQNACFAGATKIQAGISKFPGTALS